MAAPMSTIFTRRAWLAVGAALLLAACASTPPVPDDARRALAPTGTLRVAVYAGSPTSLVQASGSAEQRGLSVEIGRELAARLGVPAAIVVYPRVAEVIAAIQRGEADFTITNATAERGRVVDFTSPLIALELGVLARQGSAVISAQAMDVAGARIGVSQGSTSERVLGTRLSKAALVPMPTLDAAAQALGAGALDAFATNKAILFELADRVPGSRVLDDRWGLEHLAIAVGKGRDAGLPYLRAFTESVRTGGQVRSAAERAGLRGTATDPTP
jgi:polar amino acid transport system substrate-binding protein